MTFRLGDDGIYRCQAFLKFAWQSHGFGTRCANPVAKVTLRQVHSATVWNAHSMNDREREGDALICDEPGLSIGVRTADCVPILLLDKQRRSVAAIHAGWRGSAAEIVRRAIKDMEDAFGSNPTDIHAAIGPCIRKCCYEVSADVFERFSAILPEESVGPAGKINLDLAEANRQQMKSAGVPEEQIFDSGLCTSCELETLHSYRREPDNPGRLLSCIMRVA